MDINNFSDEDLKELLLENNYIYIGEHKQDDFYKINI